MKLAAIVIVISSLGVLLQGCSVFDTRSAGRPPARGPQTTGTLPPGPTGGGYYKDDGPGDNPPANLAGIPDAVPKLEPAHPGTRKPYTALGRDYVPMADGRGYKSSGLASWYGRRYHGKPTANGEIYDMYAMSAAHPTLPIPSYVRVSNPANGRAVVVRVNDRGPFHPDRIIDLSYTAAWKLDILRGVTPVEVEYLDPAVPTQATAAMAVAPITTTTPLPPLAPTPPEITAAVPGAYLQIGAFANPESAEKLMRQVRDRLGDSLPGVHRLDINGLVKVQVGPYPSHAAAEPAAIALELETGVRPHRVLR